MKANSVLNVILTIEELDGLIMDLVKLKESQGHRNIPNERNYCSTIKADSSFLTNEDMKITFWKVDKIEKQETLDLMEDE